MSYVRITATVFLPFAAGYFLSYLYRSINAIIAPDLTRDLGLGAADLGLLTSVYFFTFACFQIPLGMLLDRFGPRRVQSVLLLFAAVGALCFAMAESRLGLSLGRALIGLGVAGCYMASLSAIFLWYPQPRWPLVNGCFLMMGGLGALSATAPVEMLLHVTDWRGLFVGLGVLTLVAAGLIFLVVPDRSAGNEREDMAAQMRGLRLIFTDRLFWAIAPASVIAMASAMAIQGLWAGPYLRDVGGLGRDGVALHLFVLATFLAAGFLFNGIVVDLLSRRGVPLIRTMRVGIVLYLLVLVALTLQIAPADFWVLAAFGVLGNVTVLAYPVLSHHFPATHSGRANTGLNLLVFGFAFALQYAIGEIIDLWPTTAAGGFHPDGYRAAFGAVLGLMAASYLWFLWATRRR